MQMLLSCQTSLVTGICRAARHHELTAMCMLAYFDGENLSTGKGGQAQGTGHGEGQ